MHSNPDRAQSHLWSFWIMPCTLTRTEQARRNKLAKTRLYVKIIFNGKPVFSTDVCQLQSDFSVKWAKSSIYLWSASRIRSSSNCSSSVNHGLKGVWWPSNRPISDDNCYSLEDYEFGSSYASYMHSEDSNQVETKYTLGELKSECCYLCCLKELSKALWDRKVFYRKFLRRSKAAGTLSPRVQLRHWWRPRRQQAQ